MTKRIEKAIDIFLDAINEGTLAKGSCSACAVGNLVCAGKGGKIVRSGISFEATVRCRSWSSAFGSSPWGKQYVNKDRFNNKEVLEDIEATDFTIMELMAIENAFELNTRINSADYRCYTKEYVRKDQIKGLEAVVKVMLEFDEQKDDVKEVFTIKAEALPFTTKAELMAI